ncbi:MAG: cache domain-containing protein [Syntrophaceticus sp.]|jgi:methyl-accepting chemotaxis protein|nr:cache domain-containing protein [Syntrophaceticus sp.]MDD4359159.1 cache domain-containing protein [Syntrophaceticus sp.]MDD4783382.1 cache domain-containing protein [Syntrophaceticus sp.]
MRSLKIKSAMLMLVSMVLLTITLILISYSYYNTNEFKFQEANARDALLTAEELLELKCPGPWQIKGGDLYKGQVVINNNFVIVDYIQRVTEAMCVVMMNNSCVATSVLDKGGCNRALNMDTYPLKQGTLKTLDAGRCYLERTEIMDQMYQTAYKPIANGDGQIIGLLYVGVQLDNIPFYEPLKMMGITGVTLALLMALVTIYSVNRSFSKPLQEVINRMQEVKVNRTAHPLPLNGGGGIKELSQAFNQMLAAIAGGQQKNHAIEAQTSHKHQQTADNQDIDISDSLTEEAADEWIAKMLGANADEDNLPKGLSFITLRQVVLFFMENRGNDITAESASNYLSLSKVTVRRYFNFLEEHELVEIEQRYGAVGRPLKIYTLIE